MWTPPGYGKLAGVGRVGGRGCEVITEPLSLEAGQLNPPRETQRGTRWQSVYTDGIPAVCQQHARPREPLVSHTDSNVGLREACVPLRDRSY